MLLSQHTNLLPSWTSELWIIFFPIKIKELLGLSCVYGRKGTAICTIYVELNFVLVLDFWHFCHTAWWEWPSTYQCRCFWWCNYSVLDCTHVIGADSFHFMSMWTFTDVEIFGFRRCCFCYVSWNGCFLCMIFVEQFCVCLISACLRFVQVSPLAQPYSVQNMSEIFGLSTAFATGAVSHIVVCIHHKFIVHLSFAVHLTIFHIRVSAASY